MTLLEELPPARSVLAVCAHPDDESFGLGALLDAFAGRGAAVAAACLTHGEASTLGMGLGGLHALRAAELEAAAAVLGLQRAVLYDHPDGGLARVDLATLAADVRSLVTTHRPDLLLAFDTGGITGHPDHRRATEAALVASGGLPVLGWAVADDVARGLNSELGTAFEGRPSSELDFSVRVHRSRQRQAIACHASQAGDNPVLWRRLALQGDREVLRWLRPPGPRAGGEAGS